MDATQSVCLVHCYFALPDYLVIQSWISTTYLFPDIDQTGPHVYHCVKFFLEWGYMPQGTPCDHIVSAPHDPLL